LIFALLAEPFLSCDGVLQRANPALESCMGKHHFRERDRERSNLFGTRKINMVGVIHLAASKQLRQLGDVRRNPPRLIARQVRRRSPAGLFLEINIGVPFACAGVASI
jgi:hypothetical protein